MGKRGVLVGTKRRPETRLKQSLVKLGDSVPHSVQDQLWAYLRQEITELDEVTRNYALHIPVLRERLVKRKKKRPVPPAKRRNRAYRHFLDATQELPVMTRRLAMLEGDGYGPEVPILRRDP